MVLWLVALIGCSCNPTPGPSLWALGTPPLEVEIDAPAGMRDVVARVEGAVEPVSAMWTDGSTDIEGLVLPASGTKAGEHWTVTVTDGGGRTARAEYIVPGPLGGNVLVLLLDDVGVDKVGVYGGTYAARTPNIDALAKTGIRFTNAYAAPVCSPTRSILLTGRYGRRTGMGMITERESREYALSEAAITIPEALDSAPGPTWSNGAIGKWHLAGPGAESWETHPNRQGFDWFAGNRGNPEYRDGRGYFHWSRNLNGVVEDSDTYLTTASVDDALARIADMPEPWFLYVAFNAPHVPLHLPPQELLSGKMRRNAGNNAKYNAMLEALDTEIGRLLKSVDPAVLERTTVFTLGDNGTSKSGVPKGRGPGPNRIKHSVFEGGVRIPMIVNGPLVSVPGSTEDELVHVADLFPTIADIAGLPLAGEEGEQLVLGDQTVELDGRSLIPLLRGQDVVVHDFVYSEVFEPNGPGPYTKDNVALRSHTHKLVRNGQQEFLYRIDGWWEGKELLHTPQGLGPEDQAAYDALSAELDVLGRKLLYEGR
ncbi:MAG: sulfatase-like hydrolase/transferase [Myxococcota bacterium]